MSESHAPTTSNLVKLFKFPFSDPRWFQKSLVTILMSLACFIIPFIPGFFIAGYSFRISRRIIKGDGTAALPEWDEWGQMLKDGFRVSAATFIYSLPVFLTFIAMYAVFFIPYISTMSRMFTNSISSPDPLPSMGSMSLIFLMYPLMGLGMLLWLLTAVFAPPALMHLVAEDSFAAAFRFSAWWKIFRANLGGFLLSLLLVLAVFMMAYMVTYALGLTVILLCLTPLIGLGSGIYLAYVASALYAASYREGMDKLALDDQPSDQQTGLQPKPKARPKAAAAKP